MVKRVTKYPKGTSTQGLILKPDSENLQNILLVHTLWKGQNQDKGTNPGFFLSRTGYVIMYANLLIIWEIRLWTEIALLTTKDFHIELYYVMSDVLIFDILMK